MRTLAEIIKGAYQLFAPYTLGPEPRPNPVSGVVEPAQRELLATPLGEVSADMLRNGLYELYYDGSDQERQEARHYLPRILELVDDFDFPLAAGMEMTFARLGIGQPAPCPALERELLAA